jgi:acylphosphatase
MPTAYHGILKFTFIDRQLLFIHYFPFQISRKIAKSALNPFKTLFLKNQENHFIKMRINTLITIEGRVHHVGFRYSALNMAKKLSIVGEARNLPNGNVYIEAEGEEENVHQFIAWCRQGPPLAKVIKVKIQDGTCMNHTGFTIR